MSSIRLNVAAINACDLPGGPTTPDISEALEALTGRPMVVSRRDLLRAAGVAAVVATGALSARTLDPLTLPEAGSRARAAWLRAGGSRAVLDPSAFGGKPLLSVSRNGGWRAVLSQAFFPGTSLPAGVELLTTGSGLLTRLRIRHDIGGFETEVVLSEWLRKEAPAVSEVDLSGLVADLGHGVALAFGGLARATLDPDWSLRIEGEAVATVLGLGERIVADTVTISLATPGMASLLSRRIARRTLITVEAGHSTWSIPPPPPSPRGAVAFGEGAFRQLTFEAAETRSGTVHRAWVARTGGDGRATYVPRGRAAARGAIPLELKDVRYARLIDGDGSYHLAASFAEEGVWLPAGGSALLVGHAPWASPFQMSASAGDVRITAAPAVRAVTAPFGDAVASPLYFPDEARTVVNLGDRRMIAPVGASALVGPGLQIIDLPITPIPVPIPTGSRLSVLRPDDMLTLRFEFYNLAIVSDSQGTRLVRQSAQLIPYVAVHFPSQHVLEQAIRDPQDIAAQLKAPLRSFLADESRLVFRVSDARATSGIRYTLEGLLDWSGFSHHVVPAARLTVSSPDLKAQMREPSKGDRIAGVPPETSLEIPWGLVLSPYEEAWWSHRKGVLKNAVSGRTELWHTSLRGGIFRSFGFSASASGVDGDVRAGSMAASSLPIGSVVLPPMGYREAPPTLRAVWAREYARRLTSDVTEVTPPTTNIFRNSFTRGIPSPSDVGGFQNRWTVVDYSGRFRGAPINVRHLMLTPLGAWLDSQASWNKNDFAGKPVTGDLVAWQHRMTMGRDQYVKIELLGRVFPFGHEAVEITLTERRVDPATGLAFLGQKLFIMIKEPVRTYSLEADPIKRRHPFKRVEIKTKETPQIEPRQVSATLGLGLTYTVPVADAYWIRTLNPLEDFLFKIEATDWDDKVHQFEMPLIWVRDAIATKRDVEPSTPPATTLNACSIAMRTASADLRGQNVAFASAAGGGGRSRVMPTTSMRFEAAVVSPAALGAVRFHPLMYRAKVRLDAVEELTGNDALTTIRIADIYRDNGYGGPNAAGRVFAEIVSAPALDFPASLSGALATPVPKLSGISATKGTFGGNLAQFGAGKFAPADFFDALNAKILGGITLKDVLGALLDLTQMPVFEKLIQGKTLVVQYDWETPVTKSAVIFLPQAGCKLTLHAEVRKSLEDGAAPPTYLVRGELGAFKLHLVKGIFDAVILTFEKITFESVNGGTPTVDPQITDVEFGGDLKYLAKLAQYLGALGKAGGSSLAVRTGDVGAAATLVEAGPLKIDVDTKGIKASLTIAIPDLTIGVFSLKNMSFYAALKLPFTGDPVTLDFAFCSRESPFELLVMGFGGGGYVLMTFDPAGMKALEISLEFGAGTTFSIGGLASGSVEIKGGLSVRYERLDVGEKLDFVVFIRIHGSLKIMGIVTVTLTFYLELRYQTFPKKSNPAIKGDKLTGTATLTIEIEILFFTIPVKLSVTKQLAGDDPRFGDLMPVQQDWDEYCEAFVLAQLGA